MSPDDPRHGLPSGYNAGCREQCCRDAMAKYERDRRTRHYLHGDLVVDGTGTRRRIQALMALGWNGDAIDALIGRRRTYTVAVLRGTGPVQRSTADLYRAAYDHLSMKLGPSWHTRNRARRNGWLPPLAWDDDRIDDPSYTPTSERNRAKSHDEVDEAVVFRVLDGEILPTTRAERFEIMRRWVDSGRSATSLARRMSWKDGRYSGPSVGQTSHSAGEAQTTDRKAS